jgi:polyhydroxyalkanoate synthase
VFQLIEWLYRENRFCQGDLTIGHKRIGPQGVSVSVLTVANTADEVAPLESIKPFIDAMRNQDAQIIQYPGEIGVCLQHLAILIGRDAYAVVWPKIISWIEAHH